MLTIMRLYLMLDMVSDVFNLFSKKNTFFLVFSLNVDVLDFFL